MTSPEALKAQIDSTEALQSVVKTMKALAAVSIHQYETAIAALHHYTHTIELGLQILLQQPAFQPAGPLIPDGDGPLGLVVFGSDQGLCGQFNPQITEHLATYLQDLGLQWSSPEADPWPHRVAVVGARPVPLVQALGLEVDAVLPVPRSVYEITGTVQELLLLIEGWRLGWRQSRSGGPPIHRILLFYHQPLTGALYEPHIHQLLPIDPERMAHLRHSPWPQRCLPTVLMDSDELLSALVQQSLFINLYRALAASLASENASRLAAMQATESNIRDRLTTLTLKYRQERQSAITAELLDVVSGFEALQQDSPDR